jgi:hypothetical protein
MKKKLELPIKDTHLKDTHFLKSYYNNLGWIPTTLDLEETFHYFTSKYSEGLNKKSQDYYLFWALMKYPYPSKEEIKNGIELQPKKISYN